MPTQPADDDSKGNDVEKRKKKLVEMCGSCTDPGGQSDGGGKMLSAGVCARRMKKIEIKKLAAGDDTRVPTISSGEEKRKGQISTAK
ncbi:hypothetical protein OUZ56_001578 [Daphnia magna]|uniref:Uncharacterized protein n=1 Tax=Daphnia magna TaxID=35525 RepID=A0ABR0A331_9CRUS|nr:hypothetical protein OUZ56_001578 [Daphnia magna]